MVVQDSSKDVSPDPTVPIGSGPPTLAELNAHYPPQFTWNQLKIFISSGDLKLLKRHKKLQQRYSDWFQRIRDEYGSMESYLLKYRLQWGKPDRLSVLRPLPEAVDGDYIEDEVEPAVEYFRADTPPHLISIILNDWPYSVPSEIEHSVIWTRQPIFHPAIIPDAVAARMDRDGMWGFTGASPYSPPPSPSSLPSCLPALAEWGIPLDFQIDREKGTPEEDEMVRSACEGVHEFVKLKWPEHTWETAWFVNPPPLQSVRGLAHIHVFARRKPLQEVVNLMSIPN